MKNLDYSKQHNALNMDKDNKLVLSYHNPEQ